MSFVLTKSFIEEVEAAVLQQKEATIRAAFEEMHPADISTVLYELDTEACKYILDLLDDKTSAEILSNLEEDTLEEFLPVFAPHELARFFDFIDSDDAVDMLEVLPLKMREEVISYIKNREKAGYILDLLRYEEDVAGGLMAKELIKANINWTVVQCIEEIRRQAERVNKIHSVYVIDDEGVLLGRVSIKEILLAEDHTQIADIYIPNIVTVYTYEDEEEVARIMQRYDLEAIPVISMRGTLLGRITIDDVMDVVKEQAEDSQRAMSGISGDIEEADSVWKLSKARLPWLMIGMMGGLVGAQFMGFFENELRVVPAMAFFIPLIMATGGNVGIQSATLVVQALADSSGLQEKLGRRLIRSLTVALLNGFVIASVVLLTNYLFTGDFRLSFVVSTALFSVVIVASLMGTITPLILNQFKVNPAVASGPFITTANDLIGLAIYFMTARLLYNL
ncbi:MAG: magnesium transporter [Bernardetiaceae bacterium]